MARRLKRSDVPTRLLVIEGGHAFTLYPEHVGEILSFLDAVPAMQTNAEKVGR